MSEPRDIGLWLSDRTVPAADKIAFCWQALDSAREGVETELEKIGKSVCHLTYRRIEGVEIDTEKLVGALEWARGQCRKQGTEPLLQTRWYGSITIALVYLQILVTRDHARAAHLCSTMLSESAVTEHPQNCLNIMRALMLRSGWLLRSQGDKIAAIQGIRCCQDVFQLAVKTLTFERKSPSIGDEMQMWVAMLKLSVGLGHLCGIPHLNEPLPLASLITLENQQPFRDALIAMCGGLESILPPPAPWTPPQTRAELARMFRGTGVELGVAGGGFSATILRESPCERLYSVDRWNDHHSLRECKEASERLARAGKGRCVVLRCSFEEALPLFEDGSLGWVYIDGYAHTGQEGGKTLEEWYGKVKTGGLFCGHDYAARWPLNVQMVDAFVARHGLTLNLTRETGEKEFPSWWAIKP